MEEHFMSRKRGIDARKSTFFKRKIMMKDSDDIG